MDLASSVMECTKRVLNLLTRPARVNLLSVAELLGERNVIVYLAIGGLAHQGKIRYLQEGNQVYVSLADDER